MSDWRKLAEQKAWREIEFWKIPHSELSDLVEVIAPHVPRVKRGDVVETYTGFLPPEDAETIEQYYSASLMETCQKILSYNSREQGQIFDRSVQKAIEVLNFFGIEYNGLHDTFVYFSDRDYFVQLDHKLGSRIFERDRRWVEEFGEGLISGQELYRRQNLYPWRKSHPILIAWRNGRFGENSALDHAFFILNEYRLYRSHFYEFVYQCESSASKGKHNWASGVQLAAEYGFRIGRSYEALLKKPYEPHALRGMKIVRSAQSGGQVRAQQIGGGRAQIIAAMQRFVANGHTVSRAAELACREGHGSTASANRQSWYREQSKL